MRKTQKVGKWAKTINRQFPESEWCGVSKGVDRCSTSLATEEEGTKTREAGEILPTLCSGEMRTGRRVWGQRRRASLEGEDLVR